MNKTLHKTTALFFSGVLSLSLLAGCTGKPSASTDVPASSTYASSTSASASSQPQSEAAVSSNAMVIAEQGVFSAGGVTLKSDGTFDPENQWEESGAGQTAHVDYANVLYQISENETGMPMVFLHGYGQSRVGWTSAQYTKNIAAIIAIKPGGAPAPDLDEYKVVTEQKIPVTFYFGDYIDNADTSIAATGMWQGMRLLSVRRGLYRSRR